MDMKKVVSMVLAGFLVLITCSAQGALSLQPQNTSRNKILFLGDSFTNGKGVSPEQSYAGVLKKYLEDHGSTWEIVISGVNGDTTATLLQRIDTVLTDDIAIVILEIGANDAFYSVPLKQIKSNLDKILEKITQNGSRTLITTFFMPAERVKGNIDYASGWLLLQIQPWKEQKALVYPKLLKCIEGSTGYFQEDNKHPNVQGNYLVARDLLSWLNPEFVLQ